MTGVLDINKCNSVYELLRATHKPLTYREIVFYMMFFQIKNEGNVVRELKDLQARKMIGREELTPKGVNRTIVCYYLRDDKK